MYKVGLTGGIACGKTTIAGLFAEHGVTIIDADQVARDLVEPGQPALAAIAARFGDEMLSHGRLDRARLRQRIFAHTDDRRWLENLLHPLIYQALERQSQASDSPYCLLVIPLILETGRRDFVDRLLVVDCRPETQRRRLGSRDGLDDQSIDRILSAQLSREERLEAANDVLVNEGPIESLRDPVQGLHRQYLKLAKEGAGPFGHGYRVSG